MKRGDIVVVAWGVNNGLNTPQKCLYDFGYYTKTGCIVYNHDETRAQDMHEFKRDEVRPATKEEEETLNWGN
jgi:hypothetical protein